MSNYDSAVNEILKNSRLMIKQIDHAKGNTSELEDAKTLVFAGMVSYYGQEMFDDIYLSFLATDFVCSDEPILDLMVKKYGISASIFSPVLKHEEGTFYESSGYQNDKTKKTKIKRCIYIDRALLKRPDVLVERITHQMNHVINSRKNSICSKRGRLAARMGISLDYLVGRNNEFLQLEEALNGLQTEEIVSEIKGFGFFEIEDKNLEKIINLMFSDVDEHKDDDMMTQIVRPLYENEEFNAILVDKRLSGRLNGIREEFDSKAGVGSYEDFLLCCDTVEKAYNNPNRVKTSSEQAKVLVKRYIDNCVEGENKNDN